ncbi:hypothetical protein BDE02_01G013700 [Populus trichocarpa]|nr:hypothetical protein BDE02_01G013700 [Populus trichocarpa]
MASDLPCILYFFFFLLFPSSLVAQRNGNATVGDSLIAGDEATLWLSPAEDFAFGFRQLDKKDLYLLAIWYNKIPDKTIVCNGEAAYGFMNDTGNFLVANANGEKLWQSFELLTDTLLPTQIMEKGGILSSRLSETNFSQGRFQFRLIQDGNAVLNTINLPTGFPYEAYFWSNTVDSNSSNAGYQVVFNESGYLYVLRASNK